MIAAHSDGEAFGRAAGGRGDLDGGACGLGDDLRPLAEHLLHVAGEVLGGFLHRSGCIGAFDNDGVGVDGEPALRNGGADRQQADRQ